jgi:hypothetical protein
MRHTVVPSGDREAFRKRALASQAHYTGAGCRYWLYEEDDLPGAFVEFFEASDKETLARAHGTSTQSPSRLYVEVDLT